jgi:hypothetical protein
MRRIFVLGFLSLLIGSVAHAAPVYDPTTGYYYETIDGFNSADATGTWWNERVAASEQSYVDPNTGNTLYGRLVTIPDAGVENLLTDGAFLPEESGITLAIGLYDPTDTGHFQWTDGSAITYGAPNTSDPTGPSNFPEPPWGNTAPSLITGDDYGGFSSTFINPVGSNYYAWGAFSSNLIFDGRIVEFTPTPDALPEPASLAVLGGAGFLGLRRRRLPASIR